MRRLLIVFGLILLPFITVGNHAQPDPIETRLAQMTLQQKVGQMFMVHLYSNTLTITGQNLLQEWQPAGVVLFDNNIGTPTQTTRLVNAYQQAMADVGAVPLFVSTDQEGGWIMRMRDGFTELPPIALLTATDNPELTWRMGEAMATEISAVGVNMNLAPVADLDTNLANPIIGRRSPGGVPHLVGRMLTAYIGGMQDGGVLATVKHFPGHGDTSEDSHVTLPIISHDRDFLASRELIPFTYAIDADVAGVMVAHIWFTAYDDQEMPASLSHNVVTGLLRQEMGYEGIIMTDAMDMKGVASRYSPEDAAVMAVMAGVDLVVYGTSFSESRQRSAMQAVLRAVEEGRIMEERINESVRRILSAKVRYGLMQWQPLDPQTVHDRIASAQTSALLPDVFDAGVTIARDSYNRLPILQDESVAIIYPGQRTLIQRECGLHHPAIQWLPVTNAPNDDEIQLAVTLAKRVETVVVFTRNAITNPAQVALVRALPAEKTIAVALYSPYDGVLFPQVGGYMLTYGPQDPGVSAVCRILFDVIPAQGQLAVTLNSPTP